MTERSRGNPANEAPLDSWKEIAAYLQRDVSTVIRWEKVEALPVHRHRHRLRSSVYAYPSELNAWRAGRAPDSSVRPEPARWPRPMAALASTCVVALLVVMGGAGPNGGSAMAAGITTRQVWEGGYGTVWGGPSYDGRYLSFNEKNLVELAVRDLRSGEVRRLTNYNSGGYIGWFESSKPSPDGTQVAFVWVDDSKGYDLRVVGVDGSEPRILIPAGDPSHETLDVMDWSPGGKHILVWWRAARNQRIRLALVAAADGDIRELRTFDLSTDRPGNASFSRDGRYVAYDYPQSPGSEDHDIFLQPADGSDETTLIRHPAHDFVMGWAPDGSGLLFASNRMGTSGAWFIRVVEGKPEGSPILVKPDLPDRFSPMGFTQDGTLYYALPISGRKLYMATLDPKTGRTTGEFSPAPVRFVGNISQPHWSPNGRYLAYLFRPRPNHNAKGLATLCVHDLDTGDERRYDLGLYVKPWSTLRWSPDGESLLFTAFTAFPGVRWGQFRVYRADPRSGAVTTILETEPGISINWAEWSPDGKGFYYSADKRRLLYHDLATGREREPYSQEGASFDWALSPDGRQIAFSRAVAPMLKALVLVPTAGGEPRELCRSELGIGISSVAWMPDGRQLLYASWSGDKLCQIPVQGGEPHCVSTSLESVRDLAVHPDGRQIALVAGEARGEVWVMENFLREVRGVE